MAYNLDSLVQIIDQVLHPPSDYSDRPLWIVDPERKPQLECVMGKARSLRQHFETHPPLSGGRIEGLESRITAAVHDAEDKLESHLADQLLSRNGRRRQRGKIIIVSPPDLQSLIDELDAANEEIAKIVDGRQILDTSSPATLTRSGPDPKKIFVGIDEDLKQLKDRLSGHESELQIIPIVGMGGIGKTTLARKAYDSPSSVHQYDVRAWSTISPDYGVKEILLGLAENLGKHPDQMHQMEIHQIGELLHRTLSSRRYLIVFDDMRDTEAWYVIQKYLPDCSNKSRIMVTTRELTLANTIASNDSHHHMHLLEKDEAWDLLSKLVFGRETCDPGLEEVGKSIAEKCGGLPLAIQVIGGLLSRANTTKDLWEQVAEDVGSAIADQDDRFSKILTLSYDHLPVHLKPCFLYMGAFLKDREIEASGLIKLLVAEGFVNPISDFTRQSYQTSTTDKTWEEAAQVYLNALVDRNLISIRGQVIDGMVESYGIHNLMRELCIKKAQQENFIFVGNHQLKNLLDETPCSHRRLSISSKIGSAYLTRICGSGEQKRSARSCLSNDCILLETYIRNSILGLRLLRVLDVMQIRFYPFPEELLQLINLRYLAFWCYQESYAPSTSRFWNLQTLIFKSGYDCCRDWMSEILGMPQLRHIHSIIGVFDGPNEDDERIYSLKENLQSLGVVHGSLLNDRFLESIPNLKELRILHIPNGDLTRLHKLEKLQVTTYSTCRIMESLISPPSLKELELCDCAINTGDMSKIGTLPNLQVLKVRQAHFESQMWEPTEGEFCQLRFLLLDNSNLAKWEAEATHFPILQRLVFKRCFSLKEFPSAVGDIETLQVIELIYCLPSLEDSALEIQEALSEDGNDDLQVLITPSY